MTIIEMADAIQPYSRVTIGQVMAVGSARAKEALTQLDAESPANLKLADNGEMPVWRYWYRVTVVGM